MKIPLAVIMAVAMLALVQPSRGSTISMCTTTAGGAISCTGSLGTSIDVFTETFTVPGGGPLAITVQTYGFGGSGAGTNAAGNPILAGGIDSLVALFSSPPETILMDGLNPIASVPGSTQFFAGCGPAEKVLIGAQLLCGDNTLTATLSPGMYTLFLSDANYVPFAVSPGPPVSSLLSDGFGDLTGGVFDTCNDSGACLDRNGNFAVDILGLPAPPSQVPEPGTVSLLVSGLAALVYKRRRGNTPA